MKIPEQIKSIVVMVFQLCLQETMIERRSSGTTYGENIGVLATAKIYSIYVIGGAAVIAIILAFIGKFTL